MFPIPSPTGLRFATVPVIKGRRVGFRRFWWWLWVGLVMGGGVDVRSRLLSAQRMCLKNWL